MMEKLTAIDIVAGVEVFDLKSNIPEIRAFDLLGRYEDTGFTPDEIKCLNVLAQGLEKRSGELYKENIQLKNEVSRVIAFYEEAQDNLVQDNKALHKEVAHLKENCKNLDIVSRGGEEDYSNMTIDGYSIADIERLKEENEGLRANAMVREQIILSGHNPMDGDIITRQLLQIGDLQGKLSKSVGVLRLAVKHISKQCDTCVNWVPGPEIPKKCKAGGCLNLLNPDKWEWQHASAMRELGIEVQ